MTELGDDDVAPPGEPDTRKRCARRVAQLRLAARVTPEAKRVTGVGLHGKRHIIERGEIEKQRGDLERTRQAELAAPIYRQRGDIEAVETNAPRIGSNFARELGNERRLARAIRADHGVQLPFRHRERNRIGGNHAAEALAHALDLQQRISHGGRPRADRRCHRARTTPQAETADQE